MILKDYLEDLNSEDAKRVRQILSEPHLEEGELKWLFQQRRLFVLNDLVKILGKDDKTKNIILGIKVNEERKRIRTGYECATCLPESYLRAIEDAFGKWGVVSFYRGRWEIKEPNLSENLPEITMRHIHAGSNILKSPRVFKKDSLDANLESIWRRIDNSYRLMFGSNYEFEHYYDLEKWAEENGPFAKP